MLLSKKEELSYVFDNEKEALIYLEELKDDVNVTGARVYRDVIFDSKGWIYIVLATRIIVFTEQFNY